MSLNNLFTDQGGRRIVLLGTIDNSPALLIAERAAFPNDVQTMELFQTSLVNIMNLGDNDVYRWYLASLSHAAADDSSDLKLTLISPCAELHIKKYSPLLLRMVTETPKIYQERVRPYMQSKREEGRLNWVFNILEGRTEQKDVMLRDPGQGGSPDGGFLLLPDFNWDRKTLTSLRLLALVERRDLWSLRDLRKSHVEWLKDMREKILDATIKLYSEIDRDMLKLYVHCIPSVYSLDYARLQD